MGGGKRGAAAPAPPPPPAGQAKIEGDDIVRNADGSYTYGDYTGATRQSVIASATRGITSEQIRKQDDQRLLRQMALGIRAAQGGK